MTETRYNLLVEPLVDAAPLGPLTLPGMLAALARDEVESFPALRPHQGMFWHMFLVQLASLALHHAGETEIPQDEGRWRELLRGLTPGFPDDEPWCLVVTDHSRPAFMQAAVPDGVKLANPVRTPDALDLLITSKNHDLKQAVAHDADPQDWLFALIALQTGEGYGGAGNQSIARMNGGSSSRPMFALAPMNVGKRDVMPRPGAWLCRDLRVLRDTREKQQVGQALDYPARDGVGLVWTVGWPEEGQLQTCDLDRWFIEICRRVRLSASPDGIIFASRGTSKMTRINAKHMKGMLDDPWAPLHKTESKGFTLSGRDFDYATINDILFSGDWALPLLAELADSDKVGEPLVLVAQALARGNSKTEGFKSRFIPVSERAARALTDRHETLGKHAKKQADEISKFEKALKGALVLIVAGAEPKADAHPNSDGVFDKIDDFTKASDKKKRDKIEKYASSAIEKLDHHADTIFFDYLWRRLEAGDAGEAVKGEFIRDLWVRTQAIFDLAAPTMPCASLLRPRAEVNARSMLRAAIRRDFESYLTPPAIEAPADAA